MNEKKKHSSDPHTYSTHDCVISRTSRGLLAADSLLVDMINNACHAWALRRSDPLDPQRPAHEKVPCGGLRAVTLSDAAEQACERVPPHALAIGHLTPQSCAAIQPFLRCLCPQAWSRRRPHGAAAGSRPYGLWVGGWRGERGVRKPRRCLISSSPSRAA